MAEESRAAPFRFRKIRAKPMPALACYPEMHYNEKMGFTTKKNGVYRKMTATVIQKLKLDAGSGNEIYVKRDDLLPFSIGGNKVRISEAFYADMQAKGCDTMIIYGSRHSNLCRVLSNLCCSRGTDCVMICSHEADE